MQIVVFAICSHSQNVTIVRIRRSKSSAECQSLALGSPLRHNGHVLVQVADRPSAAGPGRISAFPPRADVADDSVVFFSPAPWHSAYITQICNRRHKSMRCALCLFVNVSTLTHSRLKRSYRAHFAVTEEPPTSADTLRSRYFRKYQCSKWNIHVVNYHVTIPFPICHVLLVVLRNQTSMCNSFWDIQWQILYGTNRFLVYMWLPTGCQW